VLFCANQLRLVIWFYRALSFSILRAAALHNLATKLVLDDVYDLWAHEVCIKILLCFIECRGWCQPSSSLFFLGKIDVMVPQLHSEGQIRPLTFKKINSVPQLLFLSQIHPYTNVMLHNTMRLMWKVLLTLDYFLSLTPSQFACWAVLQKVDQTYACYSYMI